MKTVAPHSRKANDSARVALAPMKLQAVLEKKYDAQFRTVFDAIRDLMTPPQRPKRTIGFSKDRA